MGPQFADPHFKTTSFAIILSVCIKALLFIHIICSSNSHDVHFERVHPELSTFIFIPWYHLWMAMLLLRFFLCISTWHVSGGEWCGMMERTSKSGDLGSSPGAAIY